MSAAIERVLERLENVREVGNQWKARCPAHDDRTPSLSIAEGEDGRVLLNCFAGCDEEAIATALGVEVADLFERNGDGPRKRIGRKSAPEPLPSGSDLEKWQRRLLENERLLHRLHELRAWTAPTLKRLGVGFDGERIVFPIRDGEGQLVNVARYRPGADSHKMLALRGRPRGLFPAPEAIKSDGMLLLVEGEADVVSAAEMGLAAVAVPGVNGWRREWAGRFQRFARLVVVLDCDLPGREAARRVAGDLQSVGAPAALLDLDPTREDGYDISDVLIEAGEEVEQASRLIDRAAQTVPLLKSEAPDTAKLLRRIAAFVRRFVVVSDAQATVVALWVLHAHAIDAADSTPYLGIASAEKRSGKSRLLEVLARLVPHPIETANITEAALFRSLTDEERSSTLLFDEIDAIFGPKARSDKEDLRGLINAGYRRGAKAYRCVGEGSRQRVEAYPVFGAKALAGIGRLPETVADRSVPIRLRRRSRNERVERGRFRTIDEGAEPLRTEAEQWATSRVSELRGARPDLPDELDDRAQDGAEPLLAIADLAEGEWPQQARAALVELHEAREESADSWKVQLLNDIRRAFGADDRMATADLLERLKADPEAPWATWREKGLTPRGLAEALKHYEITSRSIRLGDASTPKGYFRRQFEDAWTRYLPSVDVQNATSATTALASQKPAVSNPPQAGFVAAGEAENLALESHCGVVADRPPDQGGDEG